MGWISQEARKWARRIALDPRTEQSKQTDERLRDEQYSGTVNDRNSCMLLNTVEQSEQNYWI